ncbi:MAG TPA: PAS domain S-box protein [Polyangiaceae bacterium]|nr:PAS domain S-box protein [Polyangiaceae bacterium]
MSFARYLTAVLFAIDRRRLAARYAIVFGLFLGIFAADYLTSWDVSLRGLYFAPVALAAWTIGWRTGCVMGAFAVAASFYCDVRALGLEHNGTFLLTDTTIHYAVYTAAVLIVSQLRAALTLLEREKEQILLAARAAEDANQLAFEASPLPLFVFDVETGIPLAANESTLSLFGYSREEFLSKPVPQLAVASDAAARERPLASGAESGGVSHYLRKDGTRFVGEYTTRQFSFRSRRARMVLIKDITERHAAEQARALLASVVQSSRDAVLTQLVDGTLTSWNEAAERLFEYSSAEVLGSSATVIVPSDRLEEHFDLIRRVSEGNPAEVVETERRRKDGSTVAVSLSLAPVHDSEGGIVAIAQTARDLTSQHEIERQLLRTQEQLRQSQKMEAIGRLAGGVAHDFNNLLSVILSYGAMLEEQAISEGRPSDEAHEVRKAAERASELTKQLLLFSRQRVIETTVFDLNALLSRIERMLLRVLGEDVDLSFVLADGAALVRGAEAHLEQAIMNLVVNARDAMPHGGTLTIETSTVELDREFVDAHVGLKPGPHILLAVTDTGHGMDEATQARIFEPFFTTKEMGKGTGLGLSTVFGIVQQCEGSIWVESELGRGTTFKIYLPRQTTPSESGGVQAGAQSEADRGHETIVLVEDAPRVRDVAKRILQRSGYVVYEMPDPEAALSFFRTHGGPVHLLLTDVVMPRMSGPELMKRVASLRPEIRVLFMSGYTDDAFADRASLQRGIPFLQKPFTPASLSSKVREVLDATSSS